jgi:hypothetical protein
MFLLKKGYLTYPLQQMKKEAVSKGQSFFKEVFKTLNFQYFNFENDKK